MLHCFKNEFNRSIAAVCLDLGANCSSLHRFGSKLQQSASVWPHIAAILVQAHVSTSASAAMPDWSVGDNSGNAVASEPFLPWQSSTTAAGSSCDGCKRVLGHPGGSWYTTNRDHALALAMKNHGETKKNQETMKENLEKPYFSSGNLLKSPPVFPLLKSVTCLPPPMS